MEGVWLYLYTFVILLMSVISKRPHIVAIIADDLGWNDVSVHGSQIATPNIDAMALHGVAVRQHYSQPLCSPSRAAFLTGRYPLHTGMQHGLILEPEPWGLPLEFKLMPQHFRNLGYSSHAVGKWHLGYFKKEYTPTHRGFQSHFGFWNGYQDYYKHTVQASFADYEGYDMRLNGSLWWGDVGRYSTDVFTERAVEIISRHDRKSSPLLLYLAHLAPHAGNQDDPLQAPKTHVDSHKHISDPERRKYAGMVSKLDESVGTVIRALAEARMLEDSIVLFVSDNGGSTSGIVHSNRGSNWPLKGEKGTPWEGGVRTVAFMWSPMLKQFGRTFHDLIHIADWLPTLYSAAGGDCKDLGDIDGVDQWNAISGQSALTNARHEILLNSDELGEYSAIRVGSLKYVNGTTFLGYLDTWTGKELPSEEIPFSDYLDKILTSETNKHFTQHDNILLTSSDIKNKVKSLTVQCKKKYSSETHEAVSNCRPRRTPCVFNIAKDPCEQDNIYDIVKNTGIIEDFERRLKRQNQKALQPQNQPRDLKADPRLHNNTWVSWLD